ncbi:hypothetical protein HDV02_006089 [Globomyces sp. JEL0801]|nr:hypothetical protein HDV02_006089 [Globomyces sp. JEL0801]
MVTVEDLDDEESHYTEELLLKKLVRELKIICQKYGIDTKGKKIDLVHRILSEIKPKEENKDPVLPDSPQIVNQENTPKPDTITTNQKVDDNVEDFFCPLCIKSHNISRLGGELMVEFIRIVVQPKKELSETIPLVMHLPLPSTIPDEHKNATNLCIDCIEINHIKYKSKFQNAESTSNDHENGLNLSPIRPELQTNDRYLKNFMRFKLFCDSTGDKSFDSTTTSGNWTDTVNKPLNTAITRFRATYPPFNKDMIKSQIRNSPTKYIQPKSALNPDAPISRYNPTSTPSKKMKSKIGNPNVTPPSKCQLNPGLYTVQAKRSVSNAHIFNSGGYSRKRPLQMGSPYSPYKKLKPSSPYVPQVNVLHANMVEKILESTTKMSEEEYQRSHKGTSIPR